jgi:hypothetical protein
MIYESGAEWLSPVVLTKGIERRVGIAMNNNEQVIMLRNDGTLP